MKLSPETTKGLFLSCSVILVLFLLLEAVLRIIDYGNPTRRTDYFYGFEGTNRSFIKKEFKGEGTFYVPSPNRSEMISYQRFPVEKGPRTYRIFALGGSTTWGMPWGIKGSFAYRLQQDLQERHPGKNIETINVGIKGWGSTRVLNLLKEVVDYEPDLLVVYTGQNEFRDAKFHKREIDRSAFQARLLEYILYSRSMYLLYDRLSLLEGKILGSRQTSYAGESFRFLFSGTFSPEAFRSFDYYRIPYISRSVERPGTPTSLGIVAPSFASEAVPGHGNPDPDGSASYRETDEFREMESSISAVTSAFEKNIISMIQVSRDHGVPIVFLEKAVNPRYISALQRYSVMEESFRENSKDIWLAQYKEGLHAMKERRYKEAFVHFDSVRKQYKPDYLIFDSLLMLYAGECLEALGRYDKARELYNFRIPATHIEMNQILNRVSLEFGVPVIHVQDELERAAENGLVGYDNFFIDEMHYTLEGYELIGHILGDFIEAEGYVTQNSDPGPDPDKETQGISKKIAVNQDEFLTSDALTSQAWSEFHRGKIDDAYEKVKRALELDPRNLQARQLIIFIYVKRGRDQDAYSEWKTAKELWEKTI